MRSSGKLRNSGVISHVPVQIFMLKLIFYQKHFCFTFCRSNLVTVCFVYNPRHFYLSAIDLVSELSYLINLQGLTHSDYTSNRDKLGGGMSTFNGEISEISGISVDHFEDGKRKCFFLSHCHSDHMKGLLTLQTTAPIYATPISALIIRRTCPQLEDNIRILENGVLNSIELSADEDGPATSFVVTALSAGHCAGACQLLFQLEGCDILYTGDFRMNLKHAQNIKQFKEIRNHTNLSLYLDSTFMKESFANFPSQSESVNKVIEIVEAFLKKSKNHKGDCCEPLVAFRYYLTI